MNDWTELEAKIWDLGKTRNFRTISTQLGLKIQQVRNIYDNAFDKFQRFPEEEKKRLSEERSFLGGETWTDDEISLLEECAKAGASYVEVSKKLPHRSYFSVQARYAKVKRGLGLLTNRVVWDDCCDEMLIELFEKNATTSEIAQVMGRSVQAIRHHAAKIGLEFPQAKRWSKGEAEIMAEAARSGVTAKEIVHKFPGRTINSVSKKLIEARRRLGVELPRRGRPKIYRDGERGSSATHHC